MQTNFLDPLSFLPIRFPLGLGPHVVGVFNYCEYPPQLKHLPKVGTYLRPDAESFARLKPDLVIVHKPPTSIAWPPRHLSSWGRVRSKLQKFSSLFCRGGSLTDDRSVIWQGAPTS
jgi:hypothetical protein